MYKIYYGKDEYTLDVKDIEKNGVPFMVVGKSILESVEIENGEIINTKWSRIV